jgi:CHC2 zinc finger
MLSVRPGEYKVGTHSNIIEQGSVREWIYQRKDTLLDKVSAQDVLRYFGVVLKFSGGDRPEQILCPFHSDSNPSARVFPSQGGKPSAFYCFTCGEKPKDIFGLWKAFKGDPEMKFSVVLRGLEEAFGIDTPEPPKRDFFAPESLRGPSEEELEIRDLLDVCERRLRDAKPNFQMKGFLVVGQCLDRLHFRIEKGTIEPEAAKAVMRKILDKIREKIRASST